MSTKVSNDPYDDIDPDDPAWDAYSLEAIAIHGRGGLSDDHITALRRAAKKLREYSHLHAPSTPSGSQR